MLKNTEEGQEDSLVVQIYVVGINFLHKYWQLQLICFG